MRRAIALASILIEKPSRESLGKQGALLPHAPRFTRASTENKPTLREKRMLARFPHRAAPLATLTSRQRLHAYSVQNVAMGRAFLARASSPKIARGRVGEEARSLLAGAPESPT